MTSTCTPILLMVSGGSDSMAMLELCARRAVELPDGATFKVLHVNHLLRGADADADEAFVVARCAELGIPCEVRRIPIAQLASESSAGMEAVAREQRYRAADEVLDAFCAELASDPADGRIYTAHTLDDRVETFLMRTLVGTGPGGLGSIPRMRGRIVRPLLSSSREELRQALRDARPGLPDSALWREDATNEDGSNFRGQVRRELLPVMRTLRPGFEQSLERTMDLIAEEDAALSSQAASVAFRNLTFGEQGASLPLTALTELDRPQARRVLRQCLLAFAEDARLESAQIERVLDNLRPGYVTELAGGIRAHVTEDALELSDVSHV